VPLQVRDLRRERICGFLLFKLDFLRSLAARSCLSLRLLSIVFGLAGASMNIVAIAGSPSAGSRSASLIEFARSHLKRVVQSFHLIAVRELPAAPLLLGRADHPAIRQAADTLRRLQEAVIANGNVIEVLMDAVRVCSLGQITDALFEVGGQYRRNM